jgi:SP family general alpha glucoside:H+ symporter-like MFS transporter
MWFPLPVTSISLALESPWWYTGKERDDNAKQSVLRLTSPKRDPTFNTDKIVDMMRHINELGKEMSAAASYLDCFKGVKRRRTETVCMLFLSQNLASDTFSNYSTYFFEQAGLMGTFLYNFDLGQ